MNPNPFYSFCRETVGFRDELLCRAASLAHSRKLKGMLSILEIGGMRSLARHTRFSDGWSTAVFHAYLSGVHRAQFQIEVCDLAEPVEVYRAFDFGTCYQSRDFTRFRVQSEVESGDENDSIRRNVCLRHDDGTQFLKTIATTPGVDLYYLDGGDDPKQTKDQFEWAVATNPQAIVLFDDWNVKGALVREAFASKLPHLFEEVSLPFKYDGIEGVHQMALYDPLKHKTGQISLL